jgi:hypothetical protein
MRQRIEQRLMLVLPVNLDEPLREIAQAHAAVARSPFTNDRLRPELDTSRRMRARCRHDSNSASMVRLRFPGTDDIG